MTLRVALVSLLLATLSLPATGADDVFLARRGGTVEFQHGGHWSPVIAGHVLQQSDEARTGDGSGAVVNFTQGGRAFLDANAHVRVGEGSSAPRLEVLSGKVRVALNNAKPGTYLFRTPTSQIAVRGTDFAFFEDGTRVEVGVYEGVVDATIDGRLTTIPTWRGVIYDKATKTLTQLAVGAIHADFKELFSTEEFLRDQAAARAAGFI